MGVERFCQYLTYLVEKGVEGSLLEGKVKLLIDAITNFYVGCMAYFSVKNCFFNAT